MLKQKKRKLKQIKQAESEVGNWQIKAAEICLLENREGIKKQTPVENLLSSSRKAEPILKDSFQIRGKLATS